MTDIERFHANVMVFSVNVEDGGRSWSGCVLIDKTVKGGDSDSKSEEVLTCIQLTSTGALSEDVLVAI
jgi:hypothetical protein